MFMVIMGLELSTFIQSSKIGKKLLISVKVIAVYTNYGINGISYLNQITKKIKMNL